MKDNNQYVDDEIFDEGEELFDDLHDIIKVIHIFGGALLAGIAVMLVFSAVSEIFVQLSFLSILGYVVMGLPMLCVFLVNSGPFFVDVGPVFYKTETKIGNFIYEKMERDHESEFAAGGLLTIFKLCIFFLLSVILCPIIVIIAMSAYEKTRKEALEYAEKNGISKDEVPTYKTKTAKLFISVCVIIIVAIIAVGLVIGIIAGLLVADEQSVYEQEFPACLESLPEEYYAKLNCKHDDCCAAAFKLDDGSMVYYGTFCNEQGMMHGKEYYIIGGVLYVSDGFGYWWINNDGELYDYIISRRHLKEVVGTAPEFQNGHSGESGEDKVYVFKNGDAYRFIKFDKNNVFLAYGHGETDAGYTNTFTLEDKDLTLIKEQVEKVLTEAE